MVVGQPRSPSQDLPGSWSSQAPDPLVPPSLSSQLPVDSVTAKLCPPRGTAATWGTGFGRAAGSLLASKMPRGHRRQGVGGTVIPRSGL